MCENFLFRLKRPLGEESGRNDCVGKNSTRRAHTMQRELGRDRGNNSVGARQVGIAHNRLGQSIAIALVLCVGATSAALAADLPIAAPIPPVAPVYNWTGFYIGGNLGAAWTGLSGSNFSDTIGSTFTAPTNVQFMGGGQVGVNYQFWGGVVVGAEVMFDWLPGTQNAQITATAPDGTQGYRIWLRASMRKALSQPARLILRRREAWCG